MLNPAARAARKESIPPVTLRDRRAWPWFALAVVAFAAGAWLRLWQLRTQVLIDDEWHAVRMLIGADAKTIATHFGFADYCIPLTLYYRWLYDHGALSEWQMHLPLVIAGIAMPAVLPWLMRDRVAWPTRAVWLALLAISPVFVYLSRTARPYALDCLCAVVAIVAFERWQRDRHRRWAVAYVLATVAAAWLHLLTIVFTLWPFVWFGLPALGDAWRRPTRASGARALIGIVVLALVTMGALALVLAPPLAGDWRSMAAKAGSGAVEGETLYRSLQMMFGVSSALPFGAMTILLALGIWRVWTRDRAFAAYVLSTSVVGASVIALSHAAWVQHAQTFVRYSLPVLPFVLLFVAEGLVFAVAQLRLQALACAAALFAILGLVAAGPIPRYYYFPNQLMGDALFQFDYAADRNPYATELDLGPVPPFYRDLASRPPGSITLIETPSRLISNYVPEVWYQAIHRQNVKFALAAPVCGGEADEYPYTATGTAFRRVARLDQLLDGATWGADYLVLRMQPWSVPPGLEQAWPDMAACAVKVGEKLGEPVYRDAQIVVFALAKK
jgi:hypothetical protein